MATDAQRLERDAQAAEAKAAIARRRLDEIQQRALVEREQRERDYDRELVESYDRERWRDTESANYRAVGEAVAASEWGQSWVAYKVAYELRRWEANEAANAAGRLGISGPHVPAHREMGLLTAVEDGMTKAVGAAVADEIDKREAERERAIEGD